MSSAHLLSLINDLLEYAKILQGGQSVHLSDVPLQQTLREIHQSMLQRAVDKHLDYSLELDAELPAWVQLDPSSLTLVLIEVLDNAIKFTDGGYVRTHVSMRVDGPQQDVLCISVIDSGLGMLEQDLLRIFEPFVQLAQSKDGEVDEDLIGYGLGLSMAQKLADLNGAKMQVQSRLGEGTTMKIEWPIRVVHSLPPFANTSEALAVNAHRSAESAVAEQRQQSRILVVDDHQLNRLVALSALKRAFADAVLDEAKNGTEAFEKMSTQAYDLVLMDLVMPDISGTEVVRRIRALPAPHGCVPVVALTANIAEDAMTECEKVQIHRVLSKPLDVDLLVKTVLELLPQPS